MSTRRAGYTLIEIMTAVVVLTIGATGIIAMQGASVRSNQDASETSTAINWATTWVERIKRDAASWIATGNTDFASPNTQYLWQATANPGLWHEPAALAPESAGADYFGFDTTVAANVRYCINVRFAVAHAFNPVTRTMVPASDANALRADVRVWWHRSANDADRTSKLCLTGAGLTAAEETSPQLRKHYLSTVVTWRAPGP
jgi:prepilin-type N-terminal cleavage/methylation domain-containing protein